MMKARSSGSNKDDNDGDSNANNNHDNGRNHDDDDAANVYSKTFVKNGYQTLRRGHKRKANQCDGRESCDDDISCCCNCTGDDDRVEESSDTHPDPKDNIINLINLALPTDKATAAMTVMEVMPTLMTQATFQIYRCGDCNRRVIVNTAHPSEKAVHDNSSVTRDADGKIAALPTKHTAPIDVAIFADTACPENESIRENGDDCSESNDGQQTTVAARNDNSATDTKDTAPIAATCSISANDVDDNNNDDHTAETFMDSKAIPIPFDDIGDGANANASTHDSACTDAIVHSDEDGGGAGKPDVSWQTAFRMPPVTTLLLEKYLRPVDLIVFRRVYKEINLFNIGYTINTRIRNNLHAIMRGKIPPWRGAPKGSGIYNADLLFDVCVQTRGMITGSIILQALYENEWPGSDFDIFTSEDVDSASAHVFRFVDKMNERFPILETYQWLGFKSSTPMLPAKLFYCYQQPYTKDLHRFMVSTNSMESDMEIYAKNDDSDGDADKREGTESAARINGADNPDNESGVSNKKKRRTKKSASRSNKKEKPARPQKITYGEYLDMDRERATFVDYRKLSVVANNTRLQFLKLEDAKIVDLVSVYNNTVKDRSEATTWRRIVENFDLSMCVVGFSPIKGLVIHSLDDLVNMEMRLHRPIASVNIYAAIRTVKRIEKYMNRGFVLKPPYFSFVLAENVCERCQAITHGPRVTFVEVIQGYNSWTISPENINDHLPFGCCIKTCDCTLEEFMLDINGLAASRQTIINDV